ncbi:J domain-containing protein [Vibrio amylolyticus]|uniref:tetratricopeptide repeat protein n=1 Tax=Vibrio amylolyticus TaxID=2847292 RepID=UPI0035513820
MKRLAVLSILFSSLAFGTSITELTPLAEKADPKAQFELATLYQSPSPDQDIDQAFYWYQEAANLGHTEAQFALATFYVEGISTEPDLAKGLFWLTKLALAGNIEAQLAIAEIYEKQKQSPENLDMAELWYSIAQPNSELAEDGYGRVLEAKFNQRKAQQVSSLDQLDIAFESEELSETPLQASDHAASDRTIPSYLFVIAIIIIVACISFFLKRKQRKKLRKKQASDTSQKSNLEGTIKFQSTTIKKQKRQLETLFRQVKKLQQMSTPEPEEQKLAIACAMFGFRVTQIPDQKQIKVRYKQLSKLYHPDLSGSDEEMKRLNSSLKIIIAKIKQK